LAPRSRREGTQRLPEVGAFQIEPRHRSGDPPVLPLRPARIDVAQALIPPAAGSSPP
jgi:hypothetical protein